MCWRRTRARGPRNKRPAPEQKRRGGAKPGAERKRRFRRKILAHHPFQRGRAGRRAGPPFFVLFSPQPGARAARTGPEVSGPVFCAGPALCAPGSALCGAGRPSGKRTDLFFAWVRAARAQKMSKMRCFFKFNVCTYSFGRMRGGLCMPVFFSKWVMEKFFALWYTGL